MTTFSEFISECKKCRLCRLREKAIQVVPGDGNPKAEIMFIGEGPGVNEDKQGIPFCGAAGKFLDELLAMINIKRNEVYIANIVKCRPPGNRDPQEDEISACRPWLDKQIEMINPKIIVTLGRFAMGKFLPGRMISKVHGEHFRMGDRNYFVMFHPAVALYNGSQREILMQDFVKLGDFLEEIRNNPEEISEADEIKELLKKGKEKKNSAQIGMGV